MSGQRLCIALRDHDYEAWQDVDHTDAAARRRWSRSYEEIVDAVADEGRRFEPWPTIVVERWPQVLEDYRRAGLIG